MIAEAMEFIKKLTIQSLKTEILQLPGDNPNSVYIKQDDGSVVRIGLEPKNRRFLVEDLNDLLAMAVDPLKTTRGEMVRRAVTYSTHAVHLLFDTDDPNCERATFPLNMHEEVEFFLERRKEPTIAPKTLMAALGTDLHGCLWSSSDLPKTVGSLHFIDRQNKSQSHTSDKSTLGLTVERAVSEKAGLPKREQVFRVRMWSNPEFPARFPLQCVLEPDTEKGQWFLWPYPESWRELVESNIQILGGKIRDALKDSGVRVMRGFLSRD